MATIINRSTRSRPRFFVGYVDGLNPDGTRRQRTKLLKGVENPRQAREELARVERDLAAGRDPFPELSIVQPKPVETVGQLVDRWAESLTNRNADDDRSKVRTYLRPRFTVSGTISVESAGPSGFQLSLQLELETNDGQTITVSGSVSVSDCAIRQVPGTCGGGFS